MTATLQQPRALALNGREWIVLDRHGEHFRGVFYMPQVQTSDGPQLIPWRELEGKTPPGLRLDRGAGYLRISARAATLDELLEQLLGGNRSAHHPETTAAFIRSTDWGAEL